MIDLTANGFKLHQSATLQQSASLLARIHELWETFPRTEKTIHFDLSQLQEIDSSFLALLLECERKAQQESRHIELNHAPSNLKNLAKLYGIDSWIQGLTQ